MLPEEAAARDSTEEGTRVGGVRGGNAVEFEFEVGCAWEEEDVGWEEEPAGIADEKDGEPGTTSDTRE